MKYYYKVLVRGREQAEGLLFSSNIAGYRNKDRSEEFDKLIYTPGVEKFPILKGTRLFLFATLEHAKRLGSYCDSEIWKVTATGVAPVKYYPKGGFREAFWTARKKHKTVRNFGDGWKNTILANSITLVERVK